MFKIIWTEKRLLSSMTLNHCAIGSVTTINGIYRSLILNNDVSDIHAFRIDSYFDSHSNTEYDLDTACVMTTEAMKKREDDFTKLHAVQSKSMKKRLLYQLDHGK